MFPTLLWAPERRAILVDVPEIAFLAIDGNGDLEEASHALARASYSVGLRFRRTGTPLHVGYAEALWDLDGTWTALIAQPHAPTPGLLRELHVDPRVRVERFAEGLAVQTLHVGSPEDEERAVGLLAGFAADRGLVFAGRHHEIYLGEGRTIVRHPVAHASSSSTWSSVSPTAGSVRTSSVGASRLAAHS